MLFLSFYWSRSPEIADVRAQALEYAGGDETKLVPGYVTTAAMATIAETLLNKPGGYLSNDVMPPSVLMDNMHNWETGALTELREAVRSLRNDFSRAQTQSGEDRDLTAADGQFHFDALNWFLPATEDEYAIGLEALTRYLQRLGDGEARFYIRADNLNFYLSTVEKRLGGLSQRLSESVREPLLRELIYSSDQMGGVSEQRTPWLEIDDVFFETRGYVWALLHVLRGIEVDFEPVLSSKNATPILRRIIEKLEATQRPLWSPMVLNSSGFGVLTNHSLVLASYVSRANAALIDLRLLLTQG